MTVVALAQDPIDWLAEAKVDSHRSREVMSSFRSLAEIRTCRFTAPHVFMRAHGRNSRWKIFEPNYWADGSALTQAYGLANVFEGWISDDRIRQIAKSYYRDICAISYNWNPMPNDSFWRIRLQGNESVQGVVGPVAAQPTHQAENGVNASTAILKGGGLQVFLDPSTPFICTPVNW